MLLLSSYTLGAALQWVLFVLTYVPRFVGTLPRRSFVYTPTTTPSTDDLFEYQVECPGGLVSSTGICVCVC